MPVLNNEPRYTAHLELLHVLSKNLKRDAAVSHENMDVFFHATILLNDKNVDFTQLAKEEHLKQATLVRSCTMMKIDDHWTSV